MKRLSMLDVLDELDGLQLHLGPGGPVGVDGQVHAVQTERCRWRQTWGGHTTERGRG